MPLWQLLWILMMRACSMFMKRLLILLLDNKVTLFVQVLLHHFPGLSCRGQRLHSRAWPGHCAQVKPTTKPSPCKKKRCKETCKSVMRLNKQQSPHYASVTWRTINKFLLNIFTPLYLFEMCLFFIRYYKHHSHNLASLKI